MWTATSENTMVPPARDTLAQVGGFLTDFKIQSSSEKPTSVQATGTLFDMRINVYKSRGL